MSMIVNVLQVVSNEKNPARMGGIFCFEWSLFKSYYS